MSTAKLSPSIERLHRHLDSDVLDMLEALAARGFTLEPEESEFRFHVKGTAVGEPLTDPEEVAEAARAYHAGQVAAPVMEEPNREEDEQNLKERLVSLLGEKGVAVRTETPGVVAAERGIFTFKCGADERTVYNALDDATRARIRSPYPDAQSYLLLCCVPVKAIPAIQRVVDASPVKAAEWEEWESFPFNLADLLPTLAETIHTEIEAVETLPQFQALINSHALQAVMDGELDPERRFTLHDTEGLRQALVECAVRLGMTVKEEADDETESPFFETKGVPSPGSSIIVTTPAEDVARQVAKESGTTGASHDRADQSAPYLTWLPVENVNAEGGTQTRVAGLSLAKVEEYKERQADGQQAPPVVVFFDGTTYWLGDGFHRYAATVERKQNVIRAEVRPGTRDDAIMWNIRANSDHGVSYTPADKRNAVELLINNPKWAHMPNREMARTCGVTHTFVGNVRERLTGSRTPPEVTVQRGDSSYTLSTANIGASRRDDADLAPEAHSSPAEAPPEATEDSHAQPEASIAAATTEASLKESPAVKSSASGSPHERLIGQLRQAGLNGLSYDEAVALGIDRETVEVAKNCQFVEQLPTGRLLYMWKPDDIVAAIREHGPLSRLDLEDLGCQSYTINSAKTDGLITQGKGGKFEIAGEAQATPAVSPQAQQPKPDPYTAIEGRLKGRALVVTRTFMPKGLGVQITVNLSGADATDALNSRLYPAKQMWPGIGDEELELIYQRLDAEAAKKKAAKKKAAARKPETPKQTTGKGWDKSPLNPANFRKGSKVCVMHAGKESVGKVVGPSSKDNRKLRVNVGGVTVEHFPSQFLPLRGGTKKSTAKKGK